MTKAPAACKMTQAIGLGETCCAFDADVGGPASSLATATSSFLAPSLATSLASSSA